jgi:hypothetical protein
MFLVSFNWMSFFCLLNFYFLTFLYSWQHLSIDLNCRSTNSIGVESMSGWNNIVPSIGFDIFIDVIYNQVKFVGDKTTLLLRWQLFDILFGVVVGVWIIPMPTNCIIKSQNAPQVQHFLAFNICVSIFKVLGWVEKGKFDRFHRKYKIWMIKINLWL